MTLIAPGAASAAGDPFEGPTADVDEHGTSLWRGAFQRLRRNLPLDVHARIKNGALRLLSAKKSAAEASGILDMDEVRAFVETHYAEDARIHRDVTARTEAIRTALRTDALSGKIGPAAQIG